VRKLPIDIETKIERLFPNLVEKAQVYNLLLSLGDKNLNVGAEQLARSILIISDGQFSVLLKIFESNFYSDPRDLIIEAEIIVGNTGDYFITPFEN
jgi:hypothetical protein